MLLIVFAILIIAGLAWYLTPSRSYERDFFRSRRIDDCPDVLVSRESSIDNEGMSSIERLLFSD